LESGTPALFSAALHRHVLEVPARNGAPGDLMVQETWVRRLSIAPPRLLISIQDLTTEYHQLRDLRTERQELVGIKQQLEHANHSLQSSLVMYARNNQKLQAEVQERARAEEELRRQTSDLMAAKDREAEHAIWLEHMVKELTTARQQAETATQTKTEFLANMSHEIRTPMTAILGYVDLLREPEISDDEKNHAVETVRRNGRHLLAIINDILDISKIEAGRMTLERLICSPRQIIDDILDLMSARAVEQKLELRADFLGPIPESVQTDPTRVRQILVNLVGNALKFTASGSVKIVTQMAVALNGSPPRLRIDVIDTGIGMTEQQLRNLFQPFTQADMTMTRQYGGTGLGLAISRRLATMLGGDITISSEYGRGSCFTLTIDPGEIVMTTARVAEKAKASAVEAEKTAERPLEQAHILIVDDAPDNRKLLSFHLKKAGAIFDLAENGEIAVRKVREARPIQPYDAVLMDMQMPVLDGYGAAGLLRQDGDRIPIIALTAHAMTGDREKCLNAGCDDFLTKPIDRVALIETLVRYAMQAKTELAVYPRED
jgi:signal transduction histidine kinase/ActR/RegA family two-component response regulator